MKEYFVDLKSLSKEQIVEILKRYNTVSPETFLEKRNKGSDDTCIRVSDLGEVFGYCDKDYYKNLSYEEMSVENYLNLISYKKENEMSNLLNDVKQLLSNLDEDTFSNFCSDGQRSIIDFCKKYDIDMSEFLSDKECYFKIDTTTINVPGDIDVDEIEFELTAILPNGDRLDVPVGSFDSVEY